jgi:adenylate cyclase
MAVEIERKFLLADSSFLQGLSGERLVQGYVSAGARATVRVRIGAGRAWLTLKGRSDGISRLEFEYPIPLADAELCVAELCEQPLLSKTRYRVPVGAHVWEVDVFDGENAGLMVAEIELSSENEPFERPDWLGAEVSGDPRYFNSSLMRHPWREWG